MAGNAEIEEEPSIEEILDSIRQIISDDDEEEGASEAMEASEVSVEEPAPEADFAAEMAMAAAQAEPEEDIIELTEPAAMDVTEKETAVPEAEPVDSIEDIMAAEPEMPEEEPEMPAPEEEIPAEMVEEEVEEAQPDPEEPEEEIDVVAEEPVAEEPVSAPVQQNEGEDHLLTNQAESAALGAFTELKKKTAVESSGGITIEDIVRAEIRPLLRDWLDKNLPSMVERLVREEIERVAKQASDD